MRVLLSIALLIFIGPLNAQNRIAYLSNASGNFDIYLIDDNGQNKKQLTENLGWDWSPQWNNSLGALIYNSSDTLNVFSVRAVGLDGVHLNLDTYGLEEFILSPDGSKALYTLKDRENRYIGMYDLNKGVNQLLVSHPSYNGRPDWSPDGKYFSFISDRDGNNELYYFVMDTGMSVRLTNSPKSEKYTSWMPDSRTIVYTYHYSENKDLEHNDIFSIAIASKKKTQITDDRTFYQEIDVSPDGKHIVFHAKRQGSDQIYITGIDGRGEFQLTRTKAYHGEPEWVAPKN